MSDDKTTCFYVEIAIPSGTKCGSCRFVSQGGYTCFLFQKSLKEGETKCAPCMEKSLESAINELARRSMNA